jgi:hypothetical protein
METFKKSPLGVPLETPHDGLDGCPNECEYTPYTGSIPCTGVLRCPYCGNEWCPKTGRYLGRKDDGWIDELNEHVLAHGCGPMTPEGENLARRSRPHGYDHATIAHEIVLRRLTQGLQE